MARFDTPTQLYESSTAQHIDLSILAPVFPSLRAGGKAGAPPLPRSAESVPESPSCPVCISRWPRYMSSKSLCEVPSLKLL